MGLECSITHVLIEERDMEKRRTPFKDRGTQGEDCHVTMEAETGATHLQVQNEDCWQTLEARTGTEAFPTAGFPGSMALAMPMWTEACRTNKQYISVVLHHPVCSILSRLPEDTPAWIGGPHWRLERLQRQHVFI